MGEDEALEEEEADSGGGVMSHPECEKLVSKTEEWNAIYPFIEWLQEKKIWLAHTLTKREYYGDKYGEFYGEDYADEPMSTMVPILQSLEDLLYEYFDVDSAVLERERRALLKTLVL